MRTQETIERKVKFITDAQGNPIEVILPYRLYKELLRLKLSQEIFARTETQEAIHKAKDDVRKGRVRKFTNVVEAVQWLDE
jgi:hypothetical protein